jgi:hypothetical protein
VATTTGCGMQELKTQFLERCRKTLFCSGRQVQDLSSHWSQGKVRDLRRVILTHARSSTPRSHPGTHPLNETAFLLLGKGLLRLHQHLPSALCLGAGAAVVAEKCQRWLRDWV